MSLCPKMTTIRSSDDKFIINGNNFISESGSYEYKGDAFNYDKEMQFIEAKGPILRPIDILLFVRGANPGVKFDYKIPTASAGGSDFDDSEILWDALGNLQDEGKKFGEIYEAQLIKSKDRKRRKFSWKLLGFGPCNRSCGSGVRSPIFRCIRDSPTRFYTPSRCLFHEKPVFHEDIYKCNLQLCPAYWQVEEYGNCLCKNGAGFRSPIVKCVQEQVSGTIEVVKESQCDSKKQIEVPNCNCSAKVRRRINALESNKLARAYSRLMGSSSNAHNPFDKTLFIQKGYKDVRNKTGVWLMCDWNDQCLEDCGMNMEQRSIYCDRTPPYTNLCDLRATPSTTRSCKHKQTCSEGVWFTSPWSSCTGDCFNLVRKRKVLCVLASVVVEDNKCNLKQKPSVQNNCPSREVNYCGPKWHYSEWSECSRSCDEGVQRRYAKCLEFNWKENILQESNRCSIFELQPIYGTCNTQMCEEILSTAESDQIIL